MCVRAGFQMQSGLIATGSGSGGRQRHKAGLSFLLFCQPFDLMRTDRGCQCPSCPKEDETAGY